MSAELYDAELSGALARPAIDVLPTSSSRKDKSSDAAPPVEAVVPAAEVPVGDPSAEAVSPVDVVPAAAPVTREPTAAEPEVRKVFGLPLTRGRRAKAVEPEAVEVPTQDVAVAEPVDEPAETHIAVEPIHEEPVAAPSLWDFGAEEPTDAPPVEAVEAPLATVVPLVPVTDHADEARALQALLEASEKGREEAEARTAAAEAATRTANNSVQEWQIRHREAESTITELAASLAGAETRMAELHQQVAALQAERDDLTSQLDAATSPTV